MGVQRVDGSRRCSSCRISAKVNALRKGCLEGVLIRCVDRACKQGVLRRCIRREYS